jgi:hypothetical protein
MYALDLVLLFYTLRGKKREIDAHSVYYTTFWYKECFHRPVEVSRVLRGRRSAACYVTGQADGEKAWITVTQSLARLVAGGAPSAES